MRRGILFTAIFVASTAADACTTVAFLDPGRPIVAYNYDFPIGYGLVFINKRGLAKTSEVPGSKAKWQSRYGSITFSQFGRDNPMAGMNEAGLVVSQMWLDEARYEAADDRPQVGVLEWMQYLLDTSANVDVALARGTEVRIESRVPLHYKLVDASGNAAVVEFLAGKRVVRQGDDLAYPVLANSSYSDSVDYLEKVGQTTTPAGSGSLQRFARAAARVNGTVSSSGDPVERAFDTLASVAQPNHTRWSVVFDPKNLSASWRSDQNSTIRSVKLGAFDLSCRSPVKLFDVHESGDGEDVAGNFRDYSRAEHEALIRKSFGETPFLGNPSEETIVQSAAFAEGSVCEE